jgi:hypothetical protein
MNRSLVVIAAAALLPVAGCTWLKEITDRNPTPPKGAEPLAKVQPEQLVAYINERAARLRSLDYGDITMSPKDHNLPLPALHGNLTAVQPRNFRMTGQGGAMGAKVDLGSNAEQFWVYFDAPATKPVFVFASHTDFDAGTARLPGGIPFEPDWVMQALGMTTLPPGNAYTVSPPDSHRTYTLSWRTVTPSRTPVVKEIVFDGDPAVDPKPQVKKHVVRDAKNVICSAEIKQAKTVPTGGTDPRTNLPLTVQFPTVVVLRWEEQKFEMELQLKNGAINKTITNEGLFTRPTISGTKPIDLARYDEYPKK